MGKARGSIPISAMTLRVPCHRVGNNRFARNLLPMVHSATVPSTILGRLTGPHGAVVHCALTPCGGAATPRRAYGKRYGRGVAAGRGRWEAPEGAFPSERLVICVSVQCSGTQASKTSSTLVWPSPATMALRASPHRLTCFPTRHSRLHSGLGYRRSRRCLALRVQIWMLSCHRFTARRDDEAVIGRHENQRWQAMSD